MQRLLTSVNVKGEPRRADGPQAQFALAKASQSIGQRLKLTFVKICGSLRPVESVLAWYVPVVPDKAVRMCVPWLCEAVVKCLPQSAGTSVELVLKSHVIGYKSEGSDRPAPH